MVVDKEGERERRGGGEASERASESANVSLVGCVNEVGSIRGPGCELTVRSKGISGRPRRGVTSPKEGADITARG